MCMFSPRAGDIDVNFIFFGGKPGLSISYQIGRCTLPSVFLN